MKKIILSVLMLILSVSFLGCETSEENSRETLVVGMEASYAPFNWTVDEAGAYEGAVKLDKSSNYVDGYDVLIAKKIAEELNMDLVIKAVDWEGLIPSLTTSKEIDLIIAGMSPTEERSLTVDFTNEYYQSTHVIVLRNDSSYASATSITDFTGASAVGQIQTIYDDLINQLTGTTHENPLGDVPTIITGIKEGIYDLTVLELPVALAIIDTNPDLTYIEFSEDYGFDISYEDSAVSIALRKGEDDLLISINNILSSISLSDREQMMQEAISRQP